MINLYLIIILVLGGIQYFYQNRSKAKIEPKSLSIEYLYWKKLFYKAYVMNKINQNTKKCRKWKSCNF